MPLWILQDDMTTLTVGVQTLHIARHGRGPPLLLLHDGTSTGERDFGALIPALAERFDVIVPDLRGHGQSPRVDRIFWPGLTRDAAGLLAALAIPRAHVVGVGDGATAALHLAIEDPERVESLVIAGARAYVPDDDVARLDALRPQNLIAVAPELAATYARLHGDGWRHLLDRYVTSFRSDRAYLDARGKMAGVRCPTLVMHGLQDPLVSSEHAETLASGISGARLVFLESGRGLSRAPAFMGALAPFLAEQLAKAPATPAPRGPSP